MISLTVLGCDGSYPRPGGACSGYLVEGGGTSIWLDAGSGTLANLQRHLDLADLGAVVLTHAHPDHWVDVLPFYIAATYVHRRTDIPVLSPAGVLDLARRHRSKLEPTFDWRVVSSGSTEAVGDLRLTFARTDHGPETLAVRIEDAEGASLGYSADTGPGWSLSELGTGLGLALCEASLGPDDERTTRHLTARQAGVTARKAEAKRLVLTHLRPEVDAARAREEASAAFGGPIEIAAIDERYEIA